MPYMSIADLPERVRSHLPPSAQAIYMEVFNHAWVQCSERADREVIAHKVAWAAVKKQYEKRGDRWVKKPQRR
jgi:cation transport regulator